MDWRRMIPESRKLAVALLGAAAVVANDVCGAPVSDGALWTAVGLLGAYIVGQGVADHGAQGAAKAAARAGAQHAAELGVARGTRADDDTRAHKHPLNG